MGETMVALDPASDQSAESDQTDNIKHNTGLIIGDDLVRAKDPSVMDEMARKKERIMMQSLRRKQQAEENRLRKLEEERLKKEEEAMKEKERKKKLGKKPFLSNINSRKKWTGLKKRVCEC